MKSYFVQSVGVIMSIFMFCIFFFIEDGKHTLLLITFFLGILFYQLQDGKLYKKYMQSIPNY